MGQDLTVSLTSTLAGAVGRGPQPHASLRFPDAQLGPIRQAVELLDCIDEAIGWAADPVDRAERVARELPDRAAALDLDTPALRGVVEFCLVDEPWDGLDPYSLLPSRGRRVIRDLLVVRHAVETSRSRGRVAAKHVLRLALDAPSVSRRAGAELPEPGHVDRPAAEAWLRGLAAQAKTRADRARQRLGALPARAQAVETQLRWCRVPTPAGRSRRRRATTLRLATVE